MRNRFRNVTSVPCQSLLNVLFIERWWFRKTGPAACHGPIGRGARVPDSCYWMHVGVLFIFVGFFFFGLKVHNMCYFNYVECKFDTALHLFLYFLRLFLFPPPPFPAPIYDQPGWFTAHDGVWVSHTRCVWTFRRFQGLPKWKEITPPFPKPRVLQFVSLCCCGGEASPRCFWPRWLVPNTTGLPVSF